ncbi:hypothetical protein COMA1_10191 [Candidatus Nitrospira nitrosa]|uniref:Uncharacterized protein n=1 Tax=Candidatus Nitrospira nitrosa TaxID=1742972 RepID=A0A0S4L294_9BACT|nr:hypothetical protein COMA1_10191 [Candidatus Nitrospira nitrosa]
MVGVGNWQYKYPALWPIGFDERFSMAFSGGIDGLVDTYGYPLVSTCT